MKSIEEFLLSLPQPIQIVGGSPLYMPDVLPKFAISINGLRAGAHAAAINCSSKDARRVKDWSYVMRPNPQTAADRKGVMVPAHQYVNRFDFGDKQPTTYFSLLQICEALKLRVELWGICGRASKWHYGDLELHYIKTRMPLVTVNDPRPQW